MALVLEVEVEEKPEAEMMLSLKKNELPGSKDRSLMIIKRRNCVCCRIW